MVHEVLFRLVYSNEEKIQYQHQLKNGIEEDTEVTT